MKGYVDKCLEAYPDTISHLDLTGGECMLLGKDIDRIFSYAKGKGLKCGMVSNAFWATDYKKAYSTLERLQRKGLSIASFSTGEDHDKYVPWMNVLNACVASATLGIDTALRIEVHSNTSSILDYMVADFRLVELAQQKKLKIVFDGWIDFNNKGNKPFTKKTAYQVSPKPSPCDSLFQSIVINPYGEVFACCGIGFCRIPQMRLGNINQESIKTIYERAFKDFLKIWLSVEGPQGALNYVKETTGNRFMIRMRHKCAACRIIFKDKTMLPYLRYKCPSIAPAIVNSYNYKAEFLNDVRTKR